jgi:Cys-rich four helix bundle protein (predicted Tat secretion target)
MSDHQSEDNKPQLSRREMLIGIGAATAAIYSGAGIAEMKHDHSHHKHDHSKHKPQYEDLLNAINVCLDKEQRCVAHCMVTFQEGDTELAECAAKVQETHAICQAFSYLLTSNSEYIKDYAKLCEIACRDCEKQCLKHEKHIECKACADSCLEVIDQIKLHLS